MATLKQLRDVFAPILAEHPDLILRGRWLFRPPIEIAIVGLYIGRTSSASGSRMALSVIPLSRFEHPLTLGYDKPFEVERVIGVPAPNRWVRTEEEGRPPRIFQDMFEPEYQAHLLRNFNAKVPAFFASFRTFDDIASWVSRFCLPPEGRGVIDKSVSWLATVQGNFVTAADRLQAYLDWMTPSWSAFGTDSGREEKAIRDVLRTGDSAIIAAFLHQMEERTITQNGLQRFWRRTPFPFEKA
ncbi:hypothetical protein ACVFYP_15775 [Roseomonas sp. F4]